MAYERERQAAVAAVVQASRLCQAVRRELVSAETLAKKDKSPVTVADFGAQAVVSRLLRQTFPNDPLVGEEESADLRGPDASTIRDKVVEHVRSILPDLDEGAVLSAIDRGGYAGGRAERFWTLDPVDGTKGFLRAEQYAVALALIEDGRPVLGVLGCPNMPVDAWEPSGECGCLFVAVRGGGAAMRPLDSDLERPIRVSEVADTTRAKFCESVEAGHSSHGKAAEIARRLGVTATPVRMDSQCKYAAVARGDASIYLRLPTRADYEEKIWDHAAGWMVITEAGGQVSDITGAALDFSLGRTLRKNRGIVATNGRLHAAVLAAVDEVLKNRHG